MPHPNLIIGSRGLVGDEKKNGIVLVFSSYSYDKLNIEDDSISVNMKFSGSWESIYIPIEAISAIFNDPVKPEFMFSFKHPRKTTVKATEQEKIAETPETDEAEAESKDNVIQLRPKK